MASRFNRPEESETVQIISALFNGVTQVLNVLSTKKPELEQAPETDIHQDLCEEILQQAREQIEQDRITRLNSMFHENLDRH